MSIHSQLAAQHCAADALFARIERAAHRNDWPATANALDSFIADMEAHLHYEERVLFPALEAASPGALGPTSVMRTEHEQMRELFLPLRDAVAGRDADALSDAMQVLLFVMQQHNAKEENVLYPIADQILPAAPGASREEGD